MSTVHRHAGQRHRRVCLRLLDWSGERGAVGPGPVTSVPAISAPRPAKVVDLPRGARWRRPLVIAHRGACGYRPEHTLAAYKRAIELGADLIEPDLVATREGVLVARHENEVSGTTDVADRPEFAGRFATKTIDGCEVSGWFTEDFTLDELRTLRARERLPELRPLNTRFDGRHRIPTLAEVLALAQRESIRCRRRIGVYPETKHPTYFAGIGLPLEEPLLHELRRVGWDRRGAPVFVQSFETANLRRLATLSRLRLVQLVGPAGAPYDEVAAGRGTTYADLVTPDGLAEVAGYAHGIGPAKSVLVPRGTDGVAGAPTAVVDDAHAAGLVVHAHTFRNEPVFLPAGPDRADPTAELRGFFDLGVDGVFGDFPDTVSEAKTAWLAARRRRAA